MGLFVYLYNYIYLLVSTCIYLYLLVSTYVIERIWLKKDPTYYMIERDPTPVSAGCQVYQPIFYKNFYKGDPKKFKKGVDIAPR